MLKIVCCDTIDCVKKNVKFIIIFCVAIFVVAAIILGTTVFTVKSTELYFVNEKGEFIQPDDGDVDVDINTLLDDFYGDSILFVNGGGVASAIERACHEIKVTAVKKVFPNTLRVYAELRAPLYSLGIDDVVCVCSYDGFVMREESPLTTAALVSVEGSLGTISKPAVGSYLRDCFDDRSEYEVLRGLFDAIKRQDGMSYSRIIDVVSKVIFSEDGVTCVTQTGAKLVIRHPNEDLLEKFSAVFGE